MSYSLIAPEQFTEKQQRFLEKFRQSIDLSSRSGAIAFNHVVSARSL